MKKICSKCGLEISAQNYSRHTARCDGSGLRIYIKQELPKSLNCKFCGKECKNLNSLRQHECRCICNPNRKAYDSFCNYISNNRKGKTAENCEEIARQRYSLKSKYENGYVNPNKGKKVNFNYIYKEHNDLEIQKWLNYIKEKNIKQPKKNYELGYHFWGYPVILKRDSKGILKSTNVFEHIYVANILLDNKLTSINTVHHINKDITDNSIYNLLIFIDKDNHKRFHNSKYAYLTYDESTHLFSCELRK